MHRSCVTMVMELLSDPGSALIHIKATSAVLQTGMQQTVIHTYSRGDGLKVGHDSCNIYSNFKKSKMLLTFCDHTLQPDDVWMVELSHDGRLREEVSPLFVRVSCLQTLDGHIDLPLPLNTETTAAHLPKLSWQTHKHKDV